MIIVTAADYIQLEIMQNVPNTIKPNLTVGRQRQLLPNASITLNVLR